MALFVLSTILGLFSLALGDLSGLDLPCGYYIGPTNDTFTADSQCAFAYWDSIIPSYIIFAMCVDDVTASVNYLRDNNMGFKVRSGGHSLNAYSKAQDEVILDLSSFNDVEMSYDEMNNTILGVGPGAATADVLNYIQGTGDINMLLPVGACPYVNLGGYAQGGGVSIYSRSIGLLGDHLVGAYVVLANGDLVMVDATNEYKDLFWAINGGGPGNWGVIVQYFFKAIVDMPDQVYYRALTYVVTDAQSIADFIKGMRYIMNVTDVGCGAAIFHDVLGSGNYLMNMRMAFVPGYNTDNMDISYGDTVSNMFDSIVLANNGVQVNDDRYISDAVDVQLVKIQAPNIGVCNRQTSVTTSRFIRNNGNFNDELIDNFAARYFNDTTQNKYGAGQTIGPAISFNTYGEGQILANDGQIVSSYPTRDAVGNFILATFWYADVAALKTAAYTWTQEYSAMFLEGLSESMYINYLENFLGTTQMEYVYTNSTAYDLLRVVKTKYDPDNIFNFEFSIPVNTPAPSTPGGSAGKEGLTTYVTLLIVGVVSLIISF